MPKTNLMAQQIKQLNRWQSAVFIMGALMMAGGAGSTFLGWTGASYLFSAGALCYASMQMLQRYEGRSVTIRRLRRIMLLSDVLLLVSGLLMFASQGNPIGLPHLTYLQYVYNKWVGTLLLAAILQLYVSFRIDNELAKEAE